MGHLPAPRIAVALAGTTSYAGATVGDAMVRGEGRALKGKCESTSS
ncbi:hypothetical protein ACPOL_6349 [Acidisarcina polymorpha]|uniref:Uncharacterized protein n=1 Tax=Acidisarcina polymorpha TaxID=2211140 RepID=A0A2Z5G8K4_9BACT|nr:hypothetical protein ACPOL_6349 [Acidisarcina polymorpha]